MSTVHITPYNRINNYRQLEQFFKTGELFDNCQIVEQLINDFSTSYEIMELGEGTNGIAYLVCQNSSCSTLDDNLKFVIKVSKTDTLGHESSSTSGHESSESSGTLVHETSSTSGHESSESSSTLGHESSTLNMLKNNLVLKNRTPHLLLSIGYIVCDNKDYIITEYTNASTLRKYLERNEFGDDTFLIVTIVFQILFTLYCLNGQFGWFRHNDLHTENVFMNSYPVEPHDWVVYQLNATYYLIKDIGCLAIIGDFGLCDYKYSTTHPGIENLPHISCPFYDIHLFINDLVYRDDTLTTVSIFNEIISMDLSPRLSAEMQLNPPDEYKDYFTNDVKWFIDKLFNDSQIQNMFQFNTLDEYERYLTNHPEIRIVNTYVFMDPTFRSNPVSPPRSSSSSSTTPVKKIETSTTPLSSPTPVDDEPFDPFKSLDDFNADPFKFGGKKHHKPLSKAKRSRHKGTTLRKRNQKNRRRL